MTPPATSTSEPTNARPCPGIASLTSTKLPSQSETLPNALSNKAKATRRRSKRDEPFRHHFVTATDPSQFKDEDARRSVRSQAMRYHRNKPNKGDTTAAKRPDRVLAHHTRPTIAGQATPANTKAHSFTPAPASSAFGALVNYTNKQSVHALACAGIRSLKYASDTSPQAAASDGDQSPRPSGDIRFRKSQPRVCRKVAKYEYTESQDGSKIRSVAITFCQIGDGLDPFKVLPQFENPRLDFVFLLRNAMRVFGTEAYVERWVPAMMSDPHVLLSQAFLVCNWLDMLAGLPGESTRTGLVRAEIMRMLSERVKNSHMYDTASTIMIIVHLLAGEIWSCDESILRCHVSGIATLIAFCGGMANFEKAYIAEMSASMCFQCDLICEAKPLPTLISRQPLHYTANDDIAIPESPLFCPRIDFMTVSNDECCSPSTCNLLRDMRHLTDLFISNNASNEVEHNLANVSAAYMSSTGLDYSKNVAGIRERLMLLPSADLPGHQGTGDWVYEACRLTAMIYATSIVCSLPLSVAAYSSQNLLWTEAESPREPHDRQIVLTTHLSELLLQVLERTDLANMWNGMAGVLYWITTVGAAAARTPTIPTILQRPLYNNPCKPRVRQCLAMYSMRSYVLLGLKHQIPILLSQKRLSRVQELVGTYG